jgi:DNA-binding NarL/FixJ family response regulator
MPLSISSLASVQPADRPTPVLVAAKQAKPDSSGGTVTRSQSAHAPTPPAKKAAQAESSADTVTLSQSAQIIQLSQQGQSPSQIAGELGIPISTVNSDLDGAAAIVTPAPAAVPVATSPKGNSAA